MKRLITTSWDDGHPKDFKLAELLDKYDLAGTFYIPQNNPQHCVMSEKELVQLSERFEIGGHTLNHIRLYDNSQQLLTHEIQGCFSWLEKLLGQKPVSFCFPGGIVNTTAIEFAHNSGFKVIRTTELLSTSFSSTYGLLPTTLQVFDHTRIDYLKNTVKRHKFNSLGEWIYSNKCSTDLFKLIDFYLERILTHGGCFHLWGHSWEIEEFNLWSKLEAIFERISGMGEFNYVQNMDVN